jgi:hypothetical protein
LAGGATYPSALNTKPALGTSGAGGGADSFTFLPLTGISSATGLIASVPATA